MQKVNILSIRSIFDITATLIIWKKICNIENSRFLLAEFRIFYTSMLLIIEWRNVNISPCFNILT